MTSKRNGNGKRDTDVTLADVVRAIQGMETSLSTRIDSLRTDVQALTKRVDAGFRKDQEFGSRITKLETRVAKLETKKR